MVLSLGLQPPPPSTWVEGLTQGIRCDWVSSPRASVVPALLERDLSWRRPGPAPQRPWLPTAESSFSGPAQLRAATVLESQADSLGWRIARVYYLTNGFEHQLLIFERGLGTAAARKFCSLTSVSIYCGTLVVVINHLDEPVGVF